MSSRAVVVFSGYNQRAVIAFLRTLEQEGLKYAVIASSKDDPIFLTNYREKVLVTRSHKELNLDDISSALFAVRKSLEVEECVIAPSTEALNRFMLDHKAELQASGGITTLVDKPLYEQISDKAAFGELCMHSGITVPGRFADIAQAELPFVAKPLTYQAPNEQVYYPVIITTEHDRDAFLSNYDTSHFYYQEFIGGDSVYLLYYIYKDGSIAKLSQQNYVQQPGGKSMVAAEISDYHESPESKKYENLLLSSGYHGLVMIEIKRFGGNDYMIEANPRFWGPSQLFVDAGTNLFKGWLYDSGVLQDRPSFKKLKKVKYCWFGGIVQAIQGNGTLAYHTISSAQFADSLAEWLNADVYNREDTRALFVKETGL